MSLGIIQSGQQKQQLSRAKQAIDHGFTVLGLLTVLPISEV